MFDRYAKCSFELDKRTLTHIKDISYYNHNYYHIELGSYGMEIIFFLRSVISSMRNVLMMIPVLTILSAGSRALSS